MEPQTTVEDTHTEPLTKPKQKRQYTKTPAREAAIQRMMEGKTKRDELAKATKILKAQEVVNKYKTKEEPKQEIKQEETQEESDEEEIPEPPKKTKKIIKKYVPPPYEEEEEDSEEEVVVIKKKPQKKKKIVYVEESDEEEPITKSREMKSQQNAKSKRSAISIGGVPKQSRDEILSLFC